MILAFVLSGLQLYFVCVVCFLWPHVCTCVVHLVVVTDLHTLLLHTNCLARKGSHLLIQMCVLQWLMLQLALLELIDETRLGL